MINSAPLQRIFILTMFIDVHAIVMRVVFFLAVSCHVVKAIANGRVSVSGSHFTFTCKSGYHLSSSGSLRCRAGSLSGPVPSCVGKLNLDNVTSFAF